MLCTSVATLAVATGAFFSQSSNLTQLQVMVGSTLVLLSLMTWITCSKHFDGLTIKQVAFTAMLLGFVGMFSEPILEDDHFRYLWDGYITATTGRPYLHPPSFYFSTPSIADNLQDLLNGINNPEITTVYGPLLQTIFAFCYLIAPGQLWPLKLILAGAMLATVLFLGRSGVHPKWILILCIHPIFIKESALTAHPDLLIGTLLLCAVQLWWRESLRWAVLIVSAAAAIKISTAVVLVFFCFDKHGKLHWPALRVGAISLIAFHLPMIAEQFVGASLGLGAFSQQWVFNPLLFRLLSSLIGDGLARVVVGGLLITLLLGLVYWQTKHGRIHQSVIIALTGMLALAPAVNPWYWLWLLPLAMIERSRVTWMAINVFLLAYAHVNGPNASSQMYVVPYWATWLQILTLLAIFYSWRSWHALAPGQSLLSKRIPSSVHASA
jgi:alpha-1,6-mannosyltransferase